MNLRTKIRRLRMRLATRLAHTSGYELASIKQTILLQAKIEDLEIRVATLEAEKGEALRQNAVLKRALRESRDVIPCRYPGHAQ